MAYVHIRKRGGGKTETIKRASITHLSDKCVGTALLDALSYPLYVGDGTESLACNSPFIDLSETPIIVSGAGANPGAVSYKSAVTVSDLLTSAEVVNVNDFVGVTPSSLIDVWSKKQNAFGYSYGGSFYKGFSMNGQIVENQVREKFHASISASTFTFNHKNRFKIQCVIFYETKNASKALLFSCIEPTALSMRNLFVGRPALMIEGKVKLPSSYVVTKRDVTQTEEIKWNKKVYDKLSAYVQLLTAAPELASQLAPRGYYEIFNVLDYLSDQNFGFINENIIESVLDTTIFNNFLQALTITLANFDRLTLSDVGLKTLNGGGNKLSVTQDLRNLCTSLYYTLDASGFLFSDRVAKHRGGATKALLNSFASHRQKNGLVSFSNLSGIEALVTAIQLASIFWAFTSNEKTANSFSRQEALISEDVITWESTSGVKTYAGKPFEWLFASNKCWIDSLTVLTYLPSKNTLSGGVNGDLVVLLGAYNNSEAVFVYAPMGEKDSLINFDLGAIENGQIFWSPEVIQYGVRKGAIATSRASGRSKDKATPIYFIDKDGSYIFGNDFEVFLTKKGAKVLSAAETQKAMAIIKSSDMKDFADDTGTQKVPFII